MTDSLFFSHEQKNQENNSNLYLAKPLSQKNPFRKGSPLHKFSLLNTFHKRPTLSREDLLFLFYKKSRRHNPSIRSRRERIFKQSVKRISLLRLPLIKQIFLKRVLKKKIRVRTALFEHSLLNVSRSKQGLAVLEPFKKTTERFQKQTPPVENSSLPIEFISSVRNTRIVVKRRVPFVFLIDGVPLAGDERNKRIKESLHKRALLKAQRAREKKKRGKEKDLYIVHVRSTLNNTIVSLTNRKGDVLFWKSSGAAGFKNSRKATSYAAQTAAEFVGKYCVTKNIKRINVILNGIGYGKQPSLKGLQLAGVEVRYIEDVTPIAHNGCRKPKKRRM